MKITKQQLKQIIIEELDSLPIDNLIGGISGLVRGMDPEDVGIVFTTVYRDMEGEQPEPEPEPQDEPETQTPIGFGREPEQLSSKNPEPIGFREELEMMIRQAIEEDKEKYENTLKEYIAKDREAQATLNHLSVQEQRVLVQLMKIMGKTRKEFEELLKNPEKLNDILELIAQEKKIQIAEKEELEEKENNPWAICTAQVGREDKKKYERCVKSVKKKNGGE